MGGKDETRSAALNSSHLRLNETFRHGGVKNCARSGALAGAPNERARLLRPAGVHGRCAWLGSGRAASRQFSLPRRCGPLSALSPARPYLGSAPLTPMASQSMESSSLSVAFAPRATRTVPA